MLNFINKVLWSIATVLIFTSGLYFTKKLSFAQFRIKDMLNSLKSNKKGESISPLETMLMGLSGRVGIGSLSGIALAIYLGGPGTIFWMWISTLVSSINAFAESVLAVVYREKGKEYKGGPFFYIEKGLNNKKLAVTYAIIILVAYIAGFLTIQVNTITKIVTDVVKVPNVIIGIIISVITLIIISKGVKRIAKVSSYLAPIMTLFYIVLCLIILIINYKNIPLIFYRILKGAFDFKAIGASVIIIGIQKGIFSNEAGIGSGAIAAGASDTDNPTTQGFVQVIGIYITSLIICTLTALVILTIDYSSLNLVDVNGIEITNYAFMHYFGNYGNIFIIITIILFAFSTIVTGYYYGEIALNFIFKKISDKGMLFFKVIVLGILILGSVISATTLWELVDIFVVIMAIINIYAILKLDKQVIEEWQIYKYKKKK